MFKIVTLSFLFLCSPLFLKAQVDVLLVPTPAEKGEIQRILNEYQKFMTASGDSLLPKEKRALATLKFSKELINNDVHVYADYDTSGNNNFVKIFPYVQKFKELFPQTVYTTLSDITLSKVKFDKIRKYYFVEATANKKTQWYSISKKIIRDSVLAKDTLVADTIRQSYTTKTNFYVRFDRVNNVSKNFKLYAISKAGVEPKLEPLPPLVIWWLEMDPEWKSFFRTKLKLEEYPSSYDIEKVSGFQELDISNQKFKTLEPLSKMHFLRKLNCTNTPITSLEGISGIESLNVLDISKTQIRSLKGIEKLINLNELYCSGLKLETIEQVRGLINLEKFHCADNELVEISAVKDLVNLKELDFSLNIKIKTIEPIRTLVAMEKLSFAKINAQNLEPLRGMINLIHLNCYNSGITSLEPIRNLHKIIFLDLDHNKITTLEPIKDFKFLTNLRISSTNITDFSPIKNYGFLRELDISNNPQITELGPIHKLEYIRVLKCFYTKVSKEEVARFKKNHPDCAITYYY